MSKTIRFMLRGTSTSADSLFVFVVPLLLMAVNLLLPGSFAQVYLHSAYVMFFLMLYVLGSAFACSYPQIALTMGARRRDVFVGIQVQVLVYVAECWLSLFVLDKFTLAMGLEQGYGFGMGHLTETPLLLLPLLFALPAGYCSGILMKKHRWLGTALMILLMVVSIVLSTLMLVVGTDAGGLWGDLYWLLPLILVLAIAAVEGGLWLLLRRTTV